MKEAKWEDVKKALLSHSKDWHFYDDDDCEVYTYNGWKMILKPEFTGWDFDVYEIGADETDIENYYSWSDAPYESKQDAINHFFHCAQCPTDWPDDEMYFGYDEYLVPVILEKKKKVKQKQRTNKRGTLHRSWAALVKHKDNYKCVNCSSEENLEAHHIKPFKKYPELRYDINNGITLCNKCHIEHHKKNGR